MKEIRILFTSVGRRVELMQAYRDAASRIGVRLVIFGADISDSAPALCFCDRTELVPRIRDERYIPRLLEICRENQIDALIPTIDTDLLLLSQKKPLFDEIGTRVVISAEDKVALCRDKRFTADYFISCGLKSPLPIDDYTQYTGGYPAFIKPKDGSSSINAFKVESESELAEYAARVDDYIVQPFVSGKEYTVDIFCDFDGDPIFITPRRRLVVRGGEVLKTQIECDTQMIEECKRLIADYKPVGAITVQLIREDVSGDDYYIEINPRYGGGAPLSIKAGADSAEMMLRLLSGEHISYIENAAADKMIFSRFDQSVVTPCKDAKPALSAVIFDLDDTLFDETDYVYSGFACVARECLASLDGAYERLCDAFRQGLPAIDTVLSEAGIKDETLKSSCLSVYRNHTPTISMREGMRELILSLRARGVKIGVITDGRPEGQRAKINALGLEALADRIIVTDELGGESFRKPCDIAFRIMQRSLGVPYASMLYVGDNPKKDFIAPAMLGMQSIFFCNENGLYSKDGSSYATRVSTVEELKAALL